MDDKIAARFWAKVDTSGECWLWTASRNHHGYGQLRVAGRLLMASRISWEIAYGRIPDGLCALHNCPGGDNPACVRPTHLWLGTKKDNSRDMAAKGRSGAQRHPETLARGDRSGSRLHPERLRRGDNHPARLHPERMARGVRNNKARLTDDQVREIRRRYAAGERQIPLARAFGVRQGTVSQVVRRATWTHVP